MLLPIMLRDLSLLPAYRTFGQSAASDIAGSLPTSDVPQHFRDRGAPGRQRRPYSGHSIRCRHAAIAARISAVRCSSKNLT